MGCCNRLNGLKKQYFVTIITIYDGISPLSISTPKVTEVTPFLSLSTEFSSEPARLQTKTFIAAHGFTARSLGA